MSSYQLILDISISELPIDGMTFLFLIFYREGIRLRVIGDSSRLPVSLQKTAREAEEATRNNSARPDTGDQLQRAEGHSASMPEPGG